MSLSNMNGLRMPYAEKIKCRHCKNTIDDRILNSRCIAYPDGKPDEVYFNYADCPNFEKGDDLLKENIQI